MYFITQSKRQAFSESRSNWAIFVSLLACLLLMCISCASESERKAIPSDSRDLVTTLLQQLPKEMVSNFKQTEDRNKVDWVYDYDKALAECRRLKKPMLVYHCRDDSKCNRYENTVLVERRFVQLSENFVCLKDYDWETGVLYLVEETPWLVIVDPDLNILYDKPGRRPSSRLMYAAEEEMERNRAVLIKEETVNKRSFLLPAVKLGMSKAEVIKILGQPYRIVRRDNVKDILICQFPDSGNEYEIPWRKGKRQLYHEPGWAPRQRKVNNEVIIFWSKETAPHIRFPGVFAYVYFDKQGQVEHVVVEVM